MILKKSKNFFTFVVYRTKKSMALATNGVSIHHTVTRAHPGCPSSQRKRQVCKSVRTSNKPRNTLKKRNFRIWNILEEAMNCCQPNGGRTFSKFFCPFCMYLDEPLFLHGLTSMLSLVCYKIEMFFRQTQMNPLN